jgi:hypothetical protein
MDGDCDPAQDGIIWADSAPGANVTASPTSLNSGLDYDAIIIGAGLSGMYQLYR